MQYNDGTVHVTLRRSALLPLKKLARGLLLFAKRPLYFDAPVLMSPLAPLVNLLHTGGMDKVIKPLKAWDVSEFSFRDIPRQKNPKSLLHAFEEIATIRRSRMSAVFL